MPAVMPSSRWSALPGRTTSTPPILRRRCPPASAAAKPAPNRHGPLNGGQGQSQIPGRRGAKVVRIPQSQSSAPRHQAYCATSFLGNSRQLLHLTTPPSGHIESLALKNSLTAADARQVEDAFQAKLATLDGAAANQSPPRPSHARPAIALSRTSAAVRPTGTAVADGIDKSRLAHPEPRRFRDKEHVRFVAKQPCLICGRRPADAHHLRFAQHRALGRKVSDEFTVPLCRGHHREVHRCGDEAAWWKNAGVDPTITARALWLGDPSAAENSDPLDVDESAIPSYWLRTIGEIPRAIGDRQRGAE